MNRVVGPGGIEPPTSPLSGVRSSHLSYGPNGERVLPVGLPLTGQVLATLLRSPGAAQAVSLRALTLCHWWSWSGSNRRPPECKSGALPAELQPLTSGARGALPLSPAPLINRGQLDAGTRETSPLPLQNSSHYSKWRCGPGSWPAAPFRPDYSERTSLT